MVYTIGAVVVVATAGGLYYVTEKKSSAKSKAAGGATGAKEEKGKKEKKRKEKKDKKKKDGAASPTEEQEEKSQGMLLVTHRSLSFPTPTPALNTVRSGLEFDGSCYRIAKFTSDAFTEAPATPGKSFLTNSWIVFSSQAGGRRVGGGQDPGNHRRVVGDIVGTGKGLKSQPMQQSQPENRN